MTESVVTVDWENGYVESSAKENTNVTQVSSLKLIIQCQQVST